MPFSMLERGPLSSMLRKHCRGAAGCMHKLGLKSGHQKNCKYIYIRERCNLRHGHDNKIYIPEHGDRV